MSDAFMLCEKCEKRFATVHLKSLRKADAGSNEGERIDHFEHHFCEDCADELKQTSPLLNPLLAAGPNAKWHKLRVIRLNPDGIIVRRIGTESENESEDWIVPTSRLPSDFRVAGMEFAVGCNEAQLEWFKRKSKHPLQNE